MGRKSHSHVFSKRKKMQLSAPSGEVEDNRWFIGFDWFMLLFAALFSGIMVTTLYQTTDPEIVDIAVYQLILGIAGVMMGIGINIRKTKLTAGINVGMPTKKHAEKVFVYVTAAFIGLEIFNRASGMIRFSAWSELAIEPAMNIALTAAVMEEALYSFAFTTLFFIAMLYMVVKVVGRYTQTEYNIAMVMASVLVGVLFVLIHVGAYGFQPTIVIQLFVNRTVYAGIFIKTRNLTVPTLLHIIHNFLVFV
jgi:hypothetical protein